LFGLESYKKVRLLAESSHLNRLLDVSTVALTRRLVSEFLRPYLRFLIIGLISMIIAAACTALLAQQMEPIIDKVFIERNAQMLVIVAIQVFALFLFKGLATYAESVSMTYVGERIVADIRQRLIDHVLRADLTFFHNTPSGELLSRFTTDVNMLHRVVSRTVTSIVKDGLTLIFLISLMFYKDKMLACIAFVVFPLALLPILKIGKRMRKSSGSIQKEMAEFSILLSQIFHGARLIKSYGMETYENHRTHSLVERIFTLVLKATRTRAAIHPIMEMLGGCAIVGVISYGGFQVIAGHQTSGAFFTFITALLFAYEPMKHLANLNAELQEKLAAAARVFAVLAVEPTIIDHPNAKPLLVKDGQITFSDVNFSYTPSKKALAHLNMIIPAGKTVALIGISGSGKSTLMNLIPRFYDPDAGSIQIDGQDIRNITLASLRAQIALVSQEVTLFDDTIRSNIAYGRMDASEDEIIAAAKAAAAHDFIIELPFGYDTRVGEQGIKLSGGQRQRLSIARAMLKNAPILLLDEATSALDTESELRVQEALKILMKGRTTLIIAHRLSTVVDADLIYMIDKGQVIDSGQHQELLTRNKQYARISKAQFTDQKLLLS
jgi:subfamily B ATP-binding cassette protein MsbA